jgi:hypothetical protein
MILVKLAEDEANAGNGSSDERSVPALPMSVNFSCQGTAKTAIIFKS